MRDGMAEVRSGPDIANAVAQTEHNQVNLVFTCDLQDSIRRFSVCKYRQWTAPKSRVFRNYFRERVCVCFEGISESGFSTMPFGFPHHVKQNEECTVLLSQRDCVWQGGQRMRRKVCGKEYTVETFWFLDRRVDAGANRKHWNGRAPEHFFGNRAKQEFFGACTTVSAQNNEICGGSAQRLLNRLPHARRTGNIHVMRYSRKPCFQTANFGLGIFQLRLHRACERIGSCAARRLRRKHMKHMDRGAICTRQRYGKRQRSFRWCRKVRWEQNALECDARARCDCSNSRGHLILPANSAPCLLRTNLTQKYSDESERLPRLAP